MLRGSYLVQIRLIDTCIGTSKSCRGSTLSSKQRGVEGEAEACREITHEVFSPMLFLHCALGYGAPPQMLVHLHGSDD